MDLWGEESETEQIHGEKQREKKEKLPSEEEERLMYERTREILAEYGYQQYEISNYAKPGYECRHNLGYWERVPYNLRNQKKTARRRQRRRRR